MLNQFSRTQLLVGPEGIRALSQARVAVFGVGGVGGYAVEALVRSGVGAIDLIDDDRVCLTNLNRQLHATRKTVGQYKVDVAEHRIREINPDCIVSTPKTYYPFCNLQSKRYDGFSLPYKSVEPWTRRRSLSAPSSPQCVR